jgi:hypothetical protein
MATKKPIDKVESFQNVSSFSEALTPSPYSLNLDPDPILLSTKKYRNTA